MEDDLEISARNFILCRGVTFDAKHPEAPYTLHNLLSMVRIVDPEALSTTKPIYAYLEFFGPAGLYEVWLDLVSLEYDTYGEEFELTNYGPFSLALPEGKFVQGRCYCLRHVPFFSTGLYEFQLRIAGLYHTVASQSLFVEE